jgi:hypothetical protein
MPRGNTTGRKPPKRPIERYEHSDKKRINNPPVGLVTPETDPVAPTHKAYEYILPRNHLTFRPSQPNTSPEALLLAFLFGFNLGFSFPFGYGLGFAPRISSRNGWGQQKEPALCRTAKPELCPCVRTSRSDLVPVPVVIWMFVAILPV